MILRASSVPEDMTFVFFSDDEYPVRIRTVGGYTVVCLLDTDEYARRIKDTRLEDFRAALGRVHI